jgi:uncharacterized integral membrane protein
MGTDPALQRSHAPDDPAVRTGRSVAQKLTPKQTATAVAVVVVVVFALLNLQGVTMHWLVGTTHTPLIVVVALAGLIGAAVGFVLGRRAQTSKGRTPPGA